MKGETVDGWVAVIAATELPDGHAIRVTVESEDVLLYRRGEDLFSIGNRCTHAGAPLHRGPVKSLGSIITVTCPAMRPVTAYDARVRDEQIEIRARRPATGTSEA